MFSDLPTFAVNYSTTCLMWLLSLGPHQHWNQNQTIKISFVCLLFSSKKEAHIVHSHNDTFTKQKIPKKFFLKFVPWYHYDINIFLLFALLVGHFDFKYVVANAAYKSMGKGVIFCLALGWIICRFSCLSNSILYSPEKNKVTKNTLSKKQIIW